MGTIGAFVLNGTLTFSETEWPIVCDAFTRAGVELSRRPDGHLRCRVVNADGVQCAQLRFHDESMNATPHDFPDPLDDFQVIRLPDVVLRVPRRGLTTFMDALVAGTPITLTAFVVAVSPDNPAKVTLRITDAPSMTKT